MMAFITGQRWQNDTTVQTQGWLALTSAAIPQLRGGPLTHKVQIGEVVTTIPTIGFNVESVTYKNLNFNVWVRSISHPTSECPRGKEIDNCS